LVAGFFGGALRIGTGQPGVGMAGGGTLLHAGGQPPPQAHGYRYQQHGKAPEQQRHHHEGKLPMLASRSSCRNGSSL